MREPSKKVYPVCAIGPSCDHLRLSEGGWIHCGFTGDCEYQRPREITRAPDPLREAVLWYFEALDVRKQKNDAVGQNGSWQSCCAWGEAAITWENAERDLREVVGKELE